MFALLCPLLSLFLSWTHPHTTRLSWSLPPRPAARPPSMSWKKSGQYILHFRAHCPSTPPSATGEKKRDRGREEGREEERKREREREREKRKGNGADMCNGIAQLMETIKHYSNFPATGVSLRQMVQFGSNPSIGMYMYAHLTGRTTSAGHVGGGTRPTSSMSSPC